MIYFGGLFENQEDVLNAFEVPESEREGIFICAAEYEYEDYDGRASVVFYQNGTLYEVHGSHCSCYGLEGQWEPEVCVVAALLRYEYLSSWFKDAVRGRATTIPTK
jgi:uncharacterized protein (DUF1330 family)